jgi:hypothetical protein
MLALGACFRVVATVLPCGPLELPPDLNHAVIEVDVSPAEPERLALPQADCESNRPPGAVATPLGRGKQPTCLVLTQRVDLDVLGARRFDELGNVARD